MATSYRPNDLQFYLNEHRYLNKTSWNNINNVFFFSHFSQELKLAHFIASFETEHRLNDSPRALTQQIPIPPQQT